MIVRSEPSGRKVPIVQTDILVIGGGPAGIAAATAAAARLSDSRLRVSLLDSSPTPGGQVWRPSTDQQHLPHPAGSAKRKALLKLAASAATICGGWRVVDAPSPGVLFALREDPPEQSQHAFLPGRQYARFHYKQLILATGARERFLPFPGWTLPGVFGAGGLQSLIKAGFDVQGKRVVVSGTGPLLLSVAAHLAEAGAVVVCLVEQASISRLAPLAAALGLHPGKLLQGLLYRARFARAPLLTGSWVTEALAGPDSWINAVRLTDGARTWDEPCDLLASGFHLVPNTELATLLGCEVHNGFVKVDDEQRTSVANVFCAGESTGIAGIAAALVEGEIAGLAAAGRMSDARRLLRRNRREQAFGLRLDRAFALRKEVSSLATPQTIVCRCEDVRLDQITDCQGWTEAKLQTRCGMGACQGRICGPAVETILGWPMDSVRPPLFPLPIAAWCGQPAYEEIP